MIIKWRTKLYVIWGKLQSSHKIFCLGGRNKLRAYLFLYLWWWFINWYLYFHISDKLLYDHDLFLQNPLIRHLRTTIQKYMHSLLCHNQPPSVLLVAQPCQKWLQIMCYWFCKVACIIIQQHNVGFEYIWINFLASNADCDQMPQIRMYVIHIFNCRGLIRFIFSF